ncbi:MAG: ABC transporter substrate-binding protein [Clostridiales bacterium]|nr:ABC transporter substrate-binding protein [Clostridiales bacterium]
MKKIRSIIAVITVAAIAAAMCMSLTSCGSKKEVYNVGICQLVQHEALDAATQGFQDALKKTLGEDKVVFDVQNASNDSAMCSTIVNSFVSKKVDLIMANATPALQAAYNATSTIPILGTSVTEYGVALNIDNFSGTVGGNVSGTSDLAPLTEQADMILELFPDAKKVGLLYCSAEPNSEYQVKVVEEYLAEKNITCTRYSFADSNDIAAVTTKAASDSDVIYVPTDNTAASCVETIGNIVRESKTPVITGESGICAGCGVATLSIDYYDLGYKTGEMAAKVLQGEEKISDMPIEYADASKQYNPTICEELGITPPEGYEPLD